MSSVGIAAFWQWWPSARPRVEAAIDGGDWGDLPTEVAGRVEAIAPGLEWEFRAGRSCAHALVVSGAGDRKLRVVAERWYRAAPPPDGTWEFHPARQADPDALNHVLEFGSKKLPLDKLRFGTSDDDGRRQVDVSVYHPDFAALPERDRDHIAYLALDWLLGEDAVEAWVGVIGTTTDPVQATDPGDRVRAMVAALIDESPRWAILRGTHPDGWPITATVQVPLRAVRWPLFDRHIAVTLPYPPRERDGMPAPDTLDALRAFEDRMVDQLDHTAALIAHETCAGRRTLHLYGAADSSAARVPAAMRADWPYGTVEVGVREDPEWEGVSHLRL